MTEPFAYRDRLTEVAERDVKEVTQKDIEYNGSWQQRGGVGAFMMMCRKWDRIEPQAKRHGYDIFEACIQDPRPEGLRDDLRDLRRYLLLIEAWLVDRDAHWMPVIEDSPRITTHCDTPDPSDEPPVVLRAPGLYTEHPSGRPWNKDDRVEVHAQSKDYPGSDRFGPLPEGDVVIGYTSLGRQNRWAVLRCNEHPIADIDREEQRFVCAVCKTELPSVAIEPHQDPVLVLKKFGIAWRNEGDSLAGTFLDYQPGDKIHNGYAHCHRLPPEFRCDSKTWWKEELLKGNNVMHHCTEEGVSRVRHYLKWLASSPPDPRGRDRRDELSNKSVG